MPWPRNDSDPLEARRRKLAEQERLLSEQMSRLTEELQHSGEPPPAEAKPVEPPVWRREEDGLFHRRVDPAPKNKAPLARQRQRDRMLVFIAIGVLLIVVMIVLWIAHVHNGAPNNGE